MHTWTEPERLQQAADAGIGVGRSVIPRADIAGLEVILPLRSRPLGLISPVWRDWGQTRTVGARCSWKTGRWKSWTRVASPLAGLKGIGAEDAILLTREVSYRNFRNRHEFAGWAGLTPTRGQAATSSAAR